MREFQKGDAVYIGADTSLSATVFGYHDHFERDRGTVQVVESVGVSNSKPYVIINGCYYHQNDITLASEIVKPPEPLTFDISEIVE